MDLHLTPVEARFRDELRAWLTDNVPKDWAERREEPLEKRFDFLKQWQRRLYDGGWAGISWPREYGGRGATLMEQAIFWEEMARLGKDRNPYRAGFAQVIGVAESRQVGQRGEQAQVAGDVFAEPQIGTMRSTRSGNRAPQ